MFELELQWVSCNKNCIFNNQHNSFHDIYFLSNIYIIVFFICIILCSIFNKSQFILKKRISFCHNAYPKAFSWNILMLNVALIMIVYTLKKLFDIDFVTESSKGHISKNWSLISVQINKMKIKKGFKMRLSRQRFKLEFTTFYQPSQETFCSFHSRFHNYGFAINEFNCTNVTFLEVSRYK